MHAQALKTHIRSTDKRIKAKNTSNYYLHFREISPYLANKYLEFEALSTQLKLHSNLRVQQNEAETVGRAGVSLKSKG